MHLPRLISFCGLSLLSLGLASCLEQFDPSADHARFERERVAADIVPAKLTASGEVPAAGAQAFDANATYATLCSSCHGAQGGGDGPAGVALNPKPRNFHDATWQASVADDHIAKVIREGGGSVGLSPTMPPWGSALGPAEIEAMVVVVRNFAKK